MYKVHMYYLKRNTDGNVAYLDGHGRLYWGHFEMDVYPHLFNSLSAARQASTKQDCHVLEWTRSIHLKRRANPADDC